MPETDYLKIPQNRVGALIGSNGKVKKSIENATGTILDIDSDDGTVYITPREDMEDPLGVWNANHIVKAVEKKKKRPLQDIKEELSEKTVKPVK